MALSHVRTQSINDLNEGSLQAQQCKLHYDQTLEFMLRNTKWSFSSVIEGLALRDLTVFNWLYVYQYPSDCLFIDKLIPDVTLFSSTDGVAYHNRELELARSELARHRVTYKVMIINGDKVIVSNEPRARAEYRKRIVDVTRYTPEFIEAFTRLLGSKIAVPIVGVKEGRALKSDLLKEYTAYVDAGTANEFNEQHEEEPPMSEFELARL